jgi:di/tricarboxylate transporter
LGFFDFTPVAAAIFVFAVIYIIVVGRRFLPRTARADNGNDQREYLSELVVTKESRSAGKSFEDAGWAGRKDLEAVEILRENRRISFKEPLKHGDMIIMRGPPAAVGELLKSPDFKLKEEIKISDKTLQSVNLVTVEALLAPRSDYAGRCLDELDLKQDYRFTVLGISHHGRRLRRRRRTQTLHFGDSLLLLGEADHLDALRRNQNLMLLVEESFPALGKRKALLTLVLLLMVIGLAISNTVSPVISIPVAAFLAIVLGCIPVHDAYKSVDWPAVITVAGMIPFGVALEKTNTAADLAGYVVQTFAQAGPTAAMGAVFLIAIILTQFIENAAVAVILSPLAYAVAEGIHVNPKPFLVGLGICVSAGFCTPFAHESTILVMNPGHYRFKHYLQFGIVLVLITWLVATFLTPLIWHFDQTANP